VGDIKLVIKGFLKKTRMMQVATCVNNQPWSCTVYFAFDENLNLYWISKPNTRHSKEIAKNPKVAGVIVYDQQPPQKSIKGLSFEGIAEVLNGSDEEKASKYYIKQLKRENTLLQDIRSGKNPHKFYRITPHKFVLFDSSNSLNPRQEYK
jgi:uncharacterized protein YhbP (UPF0306 family)